MKKLCIIGMGNMGSAIYERLTGFEAFEVVGVGRENDLDKGLTGADVLILAVKPQNFGELGGPDVFKGFGGLLISIMAGVGVEKIQKNLGVKRVVRVMPNLALKYGKSMSGWFASDECSEQDKWVVKEILLTFGSELELKKEESLAVVTAVPGSGPAYFMKLVELLGDFALKEGFGANEARMLAEQTLLGAGAILEGSGLEAGEILKKISSKGGTTESALEVLEREGFEKMFDRALMTAKKRGEELNR